ncbi:hypothetical protein Bca4012_040136 [Brassica carinata]|uniref:RRM domain-containing protein n=1 Tax=Brassica carinata TaxID=52824 RepID=A0A8X7WA30_BRACI|nr:hypothetical protein Bca52824_008365 [Brassica carinata]
MEEEGTKERMKSQEADRKKLAECIHLVSIQTLKHNLHRKKAGGFRGQLFSEGWVEFAKKSTAKRVADMLNGERIGIPSNTLFIVSSLNDYVYKSAIREQKLNMVLSAAKREKDFYLSKVEKSRAMTEIDERMKKILLTCTSCLVLYCSVFVVVRKRKIQEESDSNAEAAPVFPPRVIRQFRQKKPVNNETSQSKPGLSTDVLASVSTFFNLIS